jgi:tetratricopeptide (TPR) repeat protein
MNDGRTESRFSWKWIKPFSVLLSALLISLIFPILIRSQSISIAQVANSQYEAGRYDSALVNYSRMIAENPAKKEAYYNRGLCYYHLKKFAEAQRDFNTSLQIDSVFEDARFMKTIVLQNNGDWNGSYNEIKRLNTTYSGYKEAKKRIQYHQLSVIINRNWYYMIAIMFLFIILVGVLTKSYAVKKGY